MLHHLCDLSLQRENTKTMSWPSKIKNSMYEEDMLMSSSYNELKKRTYNVASRAKYRGISQDKSLS